MAAKRSSQYGMVMEMPLDFVAEVTCFREREGELEDAIDPLAREARLLSDELALRALEYAPAHRGVLALGVLTHHVVVDIAGLAAGERTGDAGHELHRAQVHVLVEVAPELDQRTPQRDVIGDGGWPPSRSEEDGVVVADQLLPVLGHPVPRFDETVAVPVEVLELQGEAEASGGGVEGAHALGHDFLADAVTGDHGDAIALHGGSFQAIRPRG